MKNYLNLISHSFIYLFGIIILSTFAVTMYSQESSNEDPCKDLPPHKDDFLLITELTIDLQQKTSDLKNKIKELNSKIPAVEGQERELKRVNDEITVLSAKDTKTPIETTRLEYLTIEEKPAIESKIQELGGKSTTDLKGELTQAENDFSWEEAKQRCLRSELTNMQSPEQDFKFWMSGIFAALISFVIIGFFITALWDEKVRQAVFAGQVGLQFIALFSIVIAIILFGITAILEAKELSALLGSIAGYILGRTMSNRGESGDAGSSGGSSGGDADGEGSGDFASKVVSIEISTQTLNLDVNKPTETLSVSFKDAAGQILTPPASAPAVKWKSRDATVASVDANGVVKRVNPGKSIITAEFNGKTANCAVTCS